MSTPPPVPATREEMMAKLEFARGWRNDDERTDIITSWLTAARAEGHAAGLRGGVARCGL